MTPIPEIDLILMQYPSDERPAVLKVTARQFGEGYAVRGEAENRRYELLCENEDGTAWVINPKGDGKP